MWYHWVQGEIRGSIPKEREGMATHSSILAWRIPLTGSLVGYSPRGRKESDTTERLHFHFLSLMSLIAQSWICPF